MRRDMPEQMVAVATGLTPDLSVLTVVIARIVSG